MQVLTACLVCGQVRRVLRGWKDMVGLRMAGKVRATGT